jgi:hypothetical protein
MDGKPREIFKRRINDIEIVTYPAYRWVWISTRYNWIYKCVLTNYKLDK